MRFLSKYFFVVSAFCMTLTSASTGWAQDYSEQDLEAEISVDEAISSPPAADELSIEPVPVSAAEPAAPEPAAPESASELSELDAQLAPSNPAGENADFEFSQVGASSNTSTKTKRADGEIVVEKMRDITLPYKERRGRFGALFTIGYEKFLPTEYYSLIQQKYYGEMLDEPIPLIGAELGFKYNFYLGSLTGIFGYSHGKVSNMKKNVDDITLSMVKAGLNFSMDNALNEPYVVPFVQGGIHQISWTEKSLVGGAVQEETPEVNWNFHFKAGLAFQLNWIENSIDPNTQADGLRSSGLENTFIEVYYASYMAPSEVSDDPSIEGEPDFSSDQIGLGLRLEF